MFLLLEETPPAPAWTVPSINGAPTTHALTHTEETTNNFHHHKLVLSVLKLYDTVHHLVYTR